MYLLILSGESNLLVTVKSHLQPQQIQSIIHQTFKKHNFAIKLLVYLAPLLLHMRTDTN
jgi:hypothetical protein